LCIDEKGVYWETLATMAKHYEREQVLIHLQIRADDTDTQWTPPHRFNLTGDRSIPFTTYAKFVVDIVPNKALFTPVASVMSPRLQAAYVN
jgi:hypothetical protein